MSNKISTIVNCSAGELRIPNQLMAELGLRVCSFEWKDSDAETILDARNISMGTIGATIDRAWEHCEGVLVCSTRGDSRGLTVVAAYLMRRMGWSLYKTLQFLNSRHAEFEIRSNFLAQLMEFEKRLQARGDEQVTRTWADKEKDETGLLTRNTYLNSQLRSDTNMEQPSRLKTNSKVKFAESLVTVIGDDKRPCLEISDFRQYEESMMGSLESEENDGTPRKPHFQTKLSPYRIRRHS